MERLKIASEIIKIAEDLVFADSDYIYDPDHDKHPGGGYHKTEKGWSKLEEKEEKKDNNKSKYNADYFKKTNSFDKDFEHTLWSKKTPRDFFENAIKYGDSGHKWEIANYYYTPSDILDKLAFDKNDLVRYKAIENDNTSGETLTKVFNAERNKKNPSNEVYEAIGKHKNTPSKILSYLRSHHNKNVRRNVAENPNTLSEDLEVMAHYNSDRIVLMNVAGNESANENTLTYLFNSYHNKDVRGELSANDSCPEDIVKILAKSKDDYVRAGAQGNLGRRKRKKEDIVNKLNEHKPLPKEIEQKIMDLDTAKLSPELRERIEDWDIEDIKKFLGWLKKQNG